MATLSAALSLTIKEDLGPQIYDAQLDMDPVWQNVIKTRIGVERAGLSRNWCFNKIFVTGMSGAYEFVSNAVMQGAALTINSDNVNVFGAPNTFPNRSESTAPSFYEKTIYLKEARGNFFTPLKWMQLDSWTSAIASAVKELIKSSARKAAWQHALAFYSPVNDPYGTGHTSTDGTDYKWIRLVDTSECVANTVPSSPAADIDPPVSIKITFTGDVAQIIGRINQVQIGQVVDIYAANGTKLTDTCGWVVSHVDVIGTPGTDRGVFWLIPMDGTDQIDKTAVTDGSWIAPRNSAGNQPSGLNSWIKTSGTVFGIDLAKQHWLKSMITAINGPVTEAELTKQYGTFHERYGTLCNLDSIIASAGVIHAMLENSDNNVRFERNGKKLNLAMGYSGISYGYEGKDFSWHISSFVEPETLFMLKLGDGNIKEYLPPTTPGTGRQGEFENEIQFVAQLGGSKSIYLHDRVVSGVYASVGDQMEAPYFRFTELCPDQVQAIKLTGCTESYA